MGKPEQLNDYLDIAAEVAECLDRGEPVVALESTIIAHGMPWPQNAATAQRVEQRVRENGAVPATIAIIDGRFKVGLDFDQIERLARAGSSVAKCSRRDLPFVVAQGALGATTVAATMIIAAMANIRVFATGGIGGVHRGAAQSFDISADLQELAATDVAVVCAGVKSILDLGLTLEYLETHGVPVIGYRTDTLPAFYCRESDFAVDYNLHSEAEIARVIRIKRELGLRGGVIVANPVPTRFAMARESVDRAIAAALSDMESDDIKGKDATPYLLQRVAELTGGESLESNIELVLNNAALAARIAGAL